MNNSELHIVVVWQNGGKFLPELQQELAGQLDILEHRKVTVTPARFSQFLERFYGDSLQRVEQKITECGNGMFNLFVVRDLKPNYDQRKTSSGYKVVNSNLFDTKARCREITNAGHLVHASDDASEAEFQYKVLTGNSIKKFEDVTTKEFKTIESEGFAGESGWSSLDDIWLMLNSSVNYVLLRNFETIETELMQEHPDIDVLTLEPKKFARLLGLKKNQKEDYRAQYSCFIDGKKVNFDLRSPQDGYYPLKWSYELLNQAVSRDKIKVVNSNDYFWSLLYHALYHKRQVSLDYLTRLYNMAQSTNSELTNRVWDPVFLLQIMESYLASIKCSPVEPEDHSVYYNFYENAYSNKEIISFRRRLRQYVFKQLSLNKKRVGRVRARFIRN